MGLTKSSKVCASGVGITAIFDFEGTIHYQEIKYRYCDFTGNLMTSMRKGVFEESLNWRGIDGAR